MSFKPGHDGTIAALDASNGRLLYSYEAEKDSFPRYSSLTPTTFLEAARRLDQIPDVIAFSGWSKTGMARDNSEAAGYYGIGAGSETVGERTIFGKTVRFYSSTHERSHIWGAYGMSPFADETPCYLLVWEGALGDFYEIDARRQVMHLGKVMTTPGNKYSFLYALADPAFSLPKGQLRNEDPGKLMALCAYGEAGTPNSEEQEIIDFLLPREGILRSLAKSDMSASPYYNIGVTHPKFTTLAKRFSDAIFERFHDFAKRNMHKGYPLLISGGCGLNCEWNRRWIESGLFEDVFIPPCTNDTGSAIGTAVDAMRHFTGSAKISWSVYAGQPFVDDLSDQPELEVKALDVSHLASELMAGKIFGWVQGNCEIGPRALGNRSIIAAPFDAETHKRLNGIKRREGFRPIAPICLEEDAGLHFDLARPSPYMLLFQRVLNPKLKAVTHVDGTARAQTVTARQNPQFHRLLSAFKEKSGVGVLCNTSLNFNGTGFINRTSDLFTYARDTGLDGFVVNDRFYKFKTERHMASSNS